MENQISNSKDHALFNLYKLGTVTTTFLTVLMSVVLFLNNMEEGTRYFNSSMAAKCTIGLLCINLAFAASAFVVFRKGMSKPTVELGVAKYLFLLPTAVSILSAVVTVLQSTEVSSPLAIAILVTSVGSALFSLSYVADLPKALAIISGYVQLFFFVLIISKLYTDFTVEMNAPMKLFIQLTACAAIINTLSDIRFFIGREKSGLFTFSKMSFIFLTVLTSFGMIFEVVPHYESYNADYVAFPFFFLSLCMPVAAQLLCAVLKARQKDDIEGGSVFSDRTTVKEFVDKILEDSQNEADK